MQLEDVYEPIHAQQIHMDQKGPLWYGYRLRMCVRDTLCKMDMKAFLSLERYWP